MTNHQLFCKILFASVVESVETVVENIASTTSQILTALFNKKYYITPLQLFTTTTVCSWHTTY